MEQPTPAPCGLAVVEHNVKKELWNCPDSSSEDLLNMTCVSKPIKSAVHARLVWAAVTRYVKSAILIRMHVCIVLAESVPHQARIPQCYKVLDVPEHLLWLKVPWRKN